VVRTGRFQVCSGTGYVLLVGTVGGEAQFSRGQCDAGQVCVTQGTGDGFCMAQPPNYAPAAELGGPLADQVRVMAAAPAASARPVMPAKMSGMAMPMPMMVKPASAPPPGKCPDGMYFDEKMKQCVKK